MHHLRPEGDLTDWFIEGPMADMLSMAKEGLSREDLPAASRPLPRQICTIGMEFPKRIPVDFVKNLEEWIDLLCQSYIKCKTKL